MRWAAALLLLCACSPGPGSDCINGCVTLAEDHYEETAWRDYLGEARGTVHEYRRGPFWKCHVRIHDVHHGGIDFEADGVGTWGHMLWTDTMHDVCPECK